MLMPNKEQVKSLVRWALVYISGIVMGYLTARGKFTSDELSTISTLLSSEGLVSIISALVLGVWGLFTHTQKNAVAVADAVPEVKKIDLKPTEEGMALAKAIASPTVVVAPS